MVLHENRRYNQRAFDYLHSVPRGMTDRNRSRINWIICNLPQPVGEILDVGAGAGKISNALVANGFHLTALDVSGNALGHNHGRRVQGDICNLPFLDRSFETVLCSEVIEHLYDAEMRATIAEICRVSNRNVVITVPYAEQLEARMTSCNACGCVFHVWGHVRSVNESMLRNLINSTDGFELSSVSTSDWKEVRGFGFLGKIKLRWLKGYMNDESVMCPSCFNTKIPIYPRTFPVKIIDRLQKYLGRESPAWALVVFTRIGVGKT